MSGRPACLFSVFRRLSLGCPVSFLGFTHVFVSCLLGCWGVGFLFRWLWVCLLAGCLAPFGFHRSFLVVGRAVSVSLGPGVFLPASYSARCASGLGCRFAALRGRSRLALSCLTACLLGPPEPLLPLSPGGFGFSCPLRLHEPSFPRALVSRSSPSPTPFNLILHIGLPVLGLARRLFRHLSCSAFMPSSGTSCPRRPSSHFSLSCL